MKTNNYPLYPRGTIAREFLNLTGRSLVDMLRAGNPAGRQSAAQDTLVAGTFTLLAMIVEA